MPNVRLLSFIFTVKASDSDRIIQQPLLVSMPFCTRCGFYFRGQGTHCDIYKTSPPKSLPDPSSQQMVRQSKSQVDSSWITQAVGYLAYNQNLQYVADSITIRGDEMTVVMNKDRVQRTWCNRWFARRAMLKQHKTDVRSGCEAHGKCFGMSDNVVHATRGDYRRCFVSGCKSRYRIEEKWSNSQIVEHVKKRHSY